MTKLKKFLFRGQQAVIASCALSMSAFLFFFGSFPCQTMDADDLLANSPTYAERPPEVVVILSEDGDPISEQQAKPEEASFPTIQSSTSETNDVVSPQTLNLSNATDLNISLDELYICGDSIASGYALYNKLDRSHVIYRSGITSFQMHSRKYLCEDENVILKDYLQEVQPKYLLMVYGSNDLGFPAKSEEFTDEYLNNINEVRKLCPTAKIIVASIPPLNSSFASSKSAMEYNNSLKEAINKSDDSDLYFADIAEQLIDKKGNLGEEFDGGDGIHLTDKAYDTMLDCLLEGNNIYE